MGIDDKLGHKTEELKGKAKEGTGRATGDERLEAEGKGDQSSSKVKQGADKLKDAAKDVKDGLTK
ncbi:CsbD family protein [Nocardioides sp. 1609]|uniref:CsbD family protein n=1 Tax=Nocardioides sp. 1609 TaxID=2508327 RepID=UPI00106F0E9B|nr:CsbD family protein [Nocardioides sp. 1609]